MRMWVVCWVAEGNIPGCDVFTDKEQAFQCLNFMMETGKTATIKTVNIQMGKTGEHQEAELHEVSKPDESEEPDEGEDIE